MVGHVGFHHAVFASVRLACGGKVNRVHEAVLTPGIQQFHAAQVGNRWSGHQHCGHEGGIRSYHALAGRCAAQRQARRTEG